MCIAVFLWQAHTQYSFLLLLNRDEYHNRPTKAVHWWEGEEIVGGRDEVAGGTWLASSRQGRVAFLTNVLELHTLPLAKSRGDLPVRFLQSRKGPMEFAKELVNEGNEYNGFNLILADIESKSMVYVSNRPKGEPMVIQEVHPGVHVLSNAKLDSPWPKAQRLKLSFKTMLDVYKASEKCICIKEMIEKLMRDTTKAEKGKLPCICSLDWELELSSIFVEVDTPLGCYGTRSTIALAIEVGGQIRFHEMYLERNLWKEQIVSYWIEKLQLQ
ncbi:uncharacterized protein LOC107775770 [Nicotiana tabacum]|uniref:Transport and Golgi organization 2 homolog n=2 Tax=Nicotiana TaxID=4085 RepID=A0A1S3YFJ8_TOBAC|nr:PREDICTED: transport and Golgi organization 2 homolog [Nicotiana sylvestris]XP_016451031.1 PREDICTED: transport and Golgi organization 2 homolog [Nicotiana tabacum]